MKKNNTKIRYMLNTKNIDYLKQGDGYLYLEDV